MSADAPEETPDPAEEPQAAQPGQPEIVKTTVLQGFEIMIGGVEGGMQFPILQIYVFEATTPEGLPMSPVALAPESAIKLGFKLVEAGTALLRAKVAAAKARPAQSDPAIGTSRESTLPRIVNRPRFRD